MFAVNWALVSPPVTLTFSGTNTAALLLVKSTSTPPRCAAALSVTVQMSVPAPMMDALAQVNGLKTANLVVCCDPPTLTTIGFESAGSSLAGCSVAATFWASLLPLSVDLRTRLESWAKAVEHATNSRIDGARVNNVLNRVELVNLKLPIAANWFVFMISDSIG
jgi:hypothetical protein